MLPCSISSLSFHLSLLSFRRRRNLLPFSSLRLSFRRRRNLSLPFVITHILLVIPTQEESIIILCYSTYPSCHYNAGGIYHYPLSFQSLIVVIPPQEESITLCLCHSTYPSCHFDAGGIYTQLPCIIRSSFLYAEK